MRGPGRVPPRAALGDLLVEQDVGAPGQASRARRAAFASPAASRSRVAAAA